MGSLKSRVPAGQLFTEQFSWAVPETYGSQRRPRRLQWALLAVPVASGLAVGLVGVTSAPIAALLTATSILTGLTFTMALRMWERSIDARRDPFVATDGPRLELLDTMRTHLVFTVVIGVVATGWLALFALFSETPPPAWLASWGNRVGIVVAAGLVTYQIALVGGALLQFYRASFDLRH